MKRRRSRLLPAVLAALMVTGGAFANRGRGGGLGQPHTSVGPVSSIGGSKLVVKVTPVGGRAEPHDMSFALSDATLYSKVVKGGVGDVAVGSPIAALAKEEGGKLAARVLIVHTPVAEDKAKTYDALVRTLAEIYRQTRTRPASVQVTGNLVQYVGVVQSLNPLVVKTVESERTFTTGPDTLVFTTPDAVIGDVTVGANVAVQGRGQQTGDPLATVVALLP